MINSKEKVRVMCERLNNYRYKDIGTIENIIYAKSGYKLRQV